eukprot:357724_1
MTHIVLFISDTHTILANKRTAIDHLQHSPINDNDSYYTVDPTIDPSSLINDIDSPNTILLTTLSHPVVGSNAKAHINPFITADPTTNRIRYIHYTHYNAVVPSGSHSTDPVFGRVAISHPLDTLVCRHSPIIKTLLTEPSTPLVCCVANDLCMTAQDLIELGITKPQHVKRIMQFVEQEEEERRKR